MKTSCGRARHAVVWGAMLAGFLLACCPRVWALNPSLDVKQYGHTSWNVRDGFTKGEINAIAQTPDGYLWLGTQFGLLRFDGVRNVTFQAPGNQQLPSNYIYSLLTSRDGTLWIGTTKGLASWKDAKLTTYAELDGKYVFQLLEDHEGVVWAGALGVPTGRLCSIKNGGVKCYGEDGSFGRGVSGLFEDSKGKLWVGVENGLWRWRPGQPTLYSLPGDPNGIRGLGEDVDGTLLVGWNGGIQRFIDGKMEPHSTLRSMGRFRAKKLLRDRDGGFWIGTQDRGIVYLHQGKAEVFGQSDGLSSECVDSIFEDREGSIWIATVNGLDRFRDFAVVSFDKNQGFSSSIVDSVLASGDGSVWLATPRGLNRWHNGQLTIYGNDLHAAPLITSSNQSDQEVHGLAAHSLFQDYLARLWVSTFSGIGYLENDRVVFLSSVPGGTVLSIAEDKPGDLWILNENVGLIHLLNGIEVNRISWARLGHQDHASTLISDPSRGGLWLGFFLGGIAYLSDGQVRASYTTTDGLGEGHVNYLRVDRDGTLWVATDGGLSRLKNGRIETLTSKNGLPCDTVHWAVEDDDHSVWLYTACGLVRIARPELDAWAAAMEEDGDAKPIIHVTVFDSSDGVRILPTATHYNPKVSKSADGKLWFAGVDGVMVVDPRHLGFNELPPPISIEQLVVDRTIYTTISNGKDPLQLPKLVRDLQIDYTALSLAAPEKIRFRYRLDGYDHDWHEAGNRRQAFYTNLPPGNYTFRVIACNNNGVWNESGATLSMVIPPAFYQTYWFIAFCAIALAGLISVLYMMRVRRVAAIYKGRMEERIHERERIARDLHDTFLQSVQGLMLKFDAIAKQIPRGDVTRQNLEKALDQADEVLAEGRDRVRDLRETSVPLGDLASAFKRVVEENSAARQFTFKTVVEGRVRHLHPLVLEETYCIGREALINALTHSEGFHVEVEITYDSRQFRLRIRDDGRGFDTAILEQGGRPDHWGLPGMKERAQRIGAQLELWSRSHTGTEVELRIPGATAYGTHKPGAKRFWFRQLSRIDR
ncbi:MAG TPA: two-component regulator propeller domain-containing protein [Terriglobales bacterium]|nr:two-component regulator propeller domain-containing protein [Terriglobales bacterium]